MQENLIYKTVSSPDDLDILLGHSASYGDLRFGFSPEYLNKLKEKLNERHAVQILAETKDGDFAGYVVGSEIIFSGHLFLSELFIDPKFSGQGIATELVKKIISFAQEVNLTGVTTETETENIPAQKLYEKIGFSKINNPNWDGITYQLKFLL